MNALEEIASLLSEERLNIEKPIPKQEALLIEQSIKDIFKRLKKIQLFRLKIILVALVVSIVCFLVSLFIVGLDPDIVGFTLFSSVVLGFVSYFYSNNYFDHDDENRLFRYENDYFLEYALKIKDKDLALYVQSVNLQDRNLLCHEKRFLMKHIDIREAEIIKNELNDKVKELLNS